MYGFGIDAVTKNQIATSTRSSPSSTTVAVTSVVGKPGSGWHERQGAYDVRESDIHGFRSGRGRRERS